jgi:uncharacterized protein YdaU (DUF1376 family)
MPTYRIAKRKTLKMIKSYEISHVILSFFKDEERRRFKITLKQQLTSYKDRAALKRRNYKKWGSFGREALHVAVDV